MAADQIDELVNSLDEETKALKLELLRICWHLRGGLSYNEAHMLTPDEINLIGKIIEDHLNMTKETGLPFF